MLDQALDRLDIPLEDRGAEPTASVEVDSTPADENTRYYNRVCVRLRLLQAGGQGSGAAQGEEASGGPSARRRRVRLPVAFLHCRKRGVRTTIRMRIDANCLSDGRDKVRTEAVLDQRM